MTIINFSDVITNSSSEVFCVYTEEGIQKIKDLVNSILEITGSEQTCDDLFEISLIPDEDIAEILEDATGIEPTEEEIMDYALKQQHDQYERPVFYGIDVKAKDSNCEKAAELLSYIDNIFEFREYW